MFTVRYRLRAAWTSLIILCHNTVLAIKFWASVMNHTFSGPSFFFLLLFFPVMRIELRDASQMLYPWAKLCSALVVFFPCSKNCNTFQAFFIFFPFNLCRNSVSLLRRHCSYDLVLFNSHMMRKRIELASLLFLSNTVGEHSQPLTENLKCAGHDCRLLCVETKIQRWNYQDFSWFDC